MIYLFLLFTIIPLLELYILVYIGKQIGFLQTFLLVIVTGILGAAMARAEGISILRKVQREMATGGIPKKDLIHGVMLLVGGVLLVTPGVITDVVGLLLLLPGTRDVIRIFLMSQFKRNIKIHTFSSPQKNEDSNVIDGELVE